MGIDWEKQEGVHWVESEQVKDSECRKMLCQRTFTDQLVSSLTGLVGFSSFMAEKQIYIFLFGRIQSSPTFFNYLWLFLGLQKKKQSCKIRLCSPSNAVVYLWLESVPKTTAKRAVVMVKWSACSPSTPTIRVQIPLKSTIFCKRSC